MRSKKRSQGNSGFHQEKYEQSIEFLLNDTPHRLFKAKEIAQQLGISQQEYTKFRAVLGAMVRDGRIIKFKKNRYCKGQKISEAVGKLRVKSQGFGFVLRDAGEDIFINQKNMGLAMHEDIVRVRLFAKYEGRSPEGEILEVVERTRTKIVGVYRRGRRLGFVVPDEIKIQRDIFIPDADNNGAKSGQKVVAQIVEWEHKHMNPTGKIVEVLGFADEPGVDVLSILHDFELPIAFPQVVEDEARTWPTEIPNKELSRRFDLRRLTTFTIDPTDAKDFDDAVSLETLSDGNFRLGVHIADVSHFVRPGSELDKEARERGTSVYLVDRVVPMLPERLSSDLCSLQAERDRLTMSVLMQMSPAGDLLSYEIRESVIQSYRRFDYQTVQDIIEGKTDDELGAIIRQMYSLSQALIRKRQKRGAIDIDSLEVDVELDEQGYPVTIHKRERLDSHRLIEEFMLLANNTVAAHVATMLADRFQEPPIFVYRIHEKPDKEKVAELMALLHAFGFQTELPKRITPHFFRKILTQIANHPAAVVLQDGVLRAMMKARYTTENLGHFALAMKNYTHFTSPIRRYPDLMVHRLLKRYLNSPSDSDRPDFAALEETCKLATEREIRAQEAERESLKMKQVEYMERHLGEVFNGVISRVMNFGIFVEIPELLVEGLVHVSNLGDDYYIFDDKKFCLIGQHHGKVFRLGDKVKVRVTRVAKNERLVDFVLVG